PHRAGRAVVAQGSLGRGRVAPQASGRARAGARRGMVPTRGSLESPRRPRPRTRSLRARGRARASQLPRPLRTRDRAGPVEPTGRRHPHVPALAGGGQQVIRVAVDDLAFLETDAIVRPATARLDPTTPAVRRLERAGGPEFLGQLQLQKDLAVGAAVVTGGGGDLPADFIIHAVIQSDTEPVTRQTVARAWQSALERAREWDVPCRSGGC